MNWLGMQRKKDIYAESPITLPELQEALETLDLDNPLSIARLCQCLEGRWQEQYQVYLLHGHPFPPLTFTEAAIEAAQRRLR